MPSAAAAQAGTQVYVGTGTVQTSLGDADTGLPRGRFTGPSLEMQLAVIFGGSQTKRTGWSTDVYIGMRFVPTDLVVGGMKSSWSSLPGEMQTGMSISGRIDNVSFGGGFEVRPFINRGDQVCDDSSPFCIGHLGKISGLLGWNYSAGVMLGRGKIQFEHMIFVANGGAGSHDFDGIGSPNSQVCGGFLLPPCEQDVDSIPLENGREFRLTYAQFLKPRMGVKAEYRDTKLNFEHTGYNETGTWDHRARAFSIGVVLLLFER